MKETPFLICANWKMNKNPLEAKHYLKQFKKLVPVKKQKHFIFFVPALTLSTVAKELKPSQFGFGAQNCHYEDSGAFTGENSPLVLKHIGATHTLVGHSETRYNIETSQKSNHNNDNTVIEKKLKALYRNSITPFLCVGELNKPTNTTWEAGKSIQQTRKIQTQAKSTKKSAPKIKNQIMDHPSWKKVYHQLQPALNITQQLVTPTEAKNYPKKLQPDNVLNSTSRIKKNLSLAPLWIVYEPVWAIGAGKTASTKHISKMLKLIHSVFKAKGRKVFTLYGGSINQNNALELAGIPEMAGFLVGGASLDPKHFFNIFKKMKQ